MKELAGLTLFFVLALFCITPDIHWLDSSELSLSALSLGIGHPPGQVTHVLLASLFQWIPFGGSGFRVALSSAVMTVLAVSVLMRVALRLWPGRIGIFSALFLGAALSPLVVMQGARTEVYALCVVFLLAALKCAGVKGDGRQPYLAGLFWGLAMVTHPLIALSFVPFLFQAKTKIFTGSLLSIVPVLLLLYLPLRSLADPVFNFGNPTTLTSFIWYVKGELYKAYSSIDAGRMYEHLIQITGLLMSIWTPIGLVLSAFALILGVRTKSWFILWVAVAITLNILPLARMSNFWATNPDVGGYLLPTVWLIGILISFSIADLTRRFPNWERRILFFCVLFLALKIGLFFVTEKLSTDWSGRRHMLYLTQYALPATQIHSASFSTFGFLKFSQAQEGFRPDTQVIYRGLSSLKQGVHDLPEAKQGDLWEPSIYRETNGQYRLRDEDLKQLKNLTSHGWFYKIGGTADPRWREKYFNHLDAVRLEIPKGLDFPQEPLVLNLSLLSWVERGRNQELEVKLLKDKLNEYDPNLK